MWGGGGREKESRTIGAAANLYLANQIREIGCDAAFLTRLERLKGKRCICK